MAMEENVDKVEKAQKDEEAEAHIEHRAVSWGEQRGEKKGERNRRKGKEERLT